MSDVKPGHSPRLSLTAGISLPLILAAFATQAAQPPRTDGGPNAQSLPELSALPRLAPEAPPAKTQAKTSDRKVLLKHIGFTGNTVYRDEALAPLVQPYLNTPISIADLYEAADKVASHYVEHGYTLASVVVPAQTVAEGTVQLEVIEGRIGKVVYEGNQSYSADVLDSYISNPAGSLYRASEFEPGLRAIDALPGMKAKAVIRPGDSYGTSDVVVRTEEDRFEGSFNVDNHGRETVGIMRYAAQAAWNNPSGAGDRLELLGLRSSDDLLEYGYIAYGLPLGWNSARLNFSYGYAKFDTSGALAGLVSGANRSARAELSLPLLVSARDRWQASLAVSDTRANTDFSGTTFRETDITLLELASAYTHTHSDFAITQVGFTMGSNFRKYSVNDTNAQRWRGELDAQHLRPLIAGLQLLAHGNIAYSPDTLPDTQVVSIGGPSTIRGFQSSEARGDWGGYASLTLRRPFRLGQYEIAGRVFADSGFVRSHNNPSAGSDSLTSAGLGADISTDRFNFRIDFSAPLDSKPVSDGRNEGRAYGALSVNF